MCGADCFFKAVSEGEREFDAIAIVGGYEGDPIDYAYPCGVCRQVMMEFCNPEKFRVITAISEEQYLQQTLAEMFRMVLDPKTCRSSEKTMELIILLIILIAVFLYVMIRGAIDEKRQKRNIATS